MINSEQFKANATRFRKRAKKLEFNLPLTRLLDMYAYAHYWAPYNAVYARRTVEEPTFPPLFLENTAWRFDVEAADILEALESIPQQVGPPPQWGTELTAEDFRQNAKLFRAVLPLHGIKLKMTSASDLYALMYFNRRYSQVMAALGAGKQLGWSPEPDFLKSSCALFGVDPRNVYTVLCDMFCYSPE